MKLTASTPKEQSIIAKIKIRKYDRLNAKIINQGLAESGYYTFYEC